MGTTLHSWPLWRWILVGLSTLALVLSAILSWHYLAGGSMPGCSVFPPASGGLPIEASMAVAVVPILAPKVKAMPVSSVTKPWPKHDN